MKTLNVKYEVVIKGDEAPFRWHIEEVGSSGHKVRIADLKGESDSIPDALFMARDAAKDHAERRRQNAMERREVIYEAELPVDVTEDLPLMGANSD